ncbi:MAG: hypothetical protein R2854_17755 [Caldilineaceae bacterium]
MVEDHGACAAIVDVTTITATARKPSLRAVTSSSARSTPIRMFDYPFYWGFADERGEGPGLGTNLNMPLPLGTTADGYLAALDHALAYVGNFMRTCLWSRWGFY